MLWGRGLKYFIFVVLFVESKEENPVINYISTYILLLVVMYLIRVCTRILHICYNVKNTTK